MYLRFIFMKNEVRTGNWTRIRSDGYFYLIIGILSNLNGTILGTGNRDGTWYLNMLHFILILGHTFCPRTMFYSSFMICSDHMFLSYTKSHSRPTLVPFQFRPSSILQIEIKKLRTHTGSYVLFQFLNMNASQFMSRLTTVNGLKVVFAH